METTFENFVHSIAKIQNVKSVLLVGSRVTENYKENSDYDIHVITQNSEISYVAFHIRHPLKVDMFVYEHNYINQLPIERKLELNEAVVLYTTDDYLFFCPEIDKESIFEKSLHWIRFHLEHIKDDYNKESNDSLKKLHKVRYLFHAVQYKEVLKGQSFRGYKSLTWSSADFKNYDSCLQSMQSGIFFELVTNFIGDENLVKLNFKPANIDIETDNFPVSIIKQSDFYSNLIKIIGSYEN